MEIFSNTQKMIAKKIDADTVISNWKDWKWQVRHTIRDIPTFEELLGIKFDDEERAELEKTISIFPLSITPYYLSLIDAADYKNDPVYKQSFPSPSELLVEQCDMEDPLAEDKDSPAPCITHRYPDRVLFLVSNVCSMYCRHCTRKRRVGNIDSIPDKSEVRKAIEYIKDHTEIRDVLLSGGDPFMLPDDHLDWILTELDNIPHVEIVRIGTRMPVVLPYRVTDELVDMLKKHQPLWINTHFNHPKELTNSSREALRKLADAGIPLGNQTVLLAGVNDCPVIMKQLCRKLVKNRVRPYYMYQCDLSEGLAHFRTSVAKGIEIIENLIGHTSGFAVPTYVIDAPGGGGKIPVMPNYLISWSANKVVLRNYEGVITTYTEPESYKPPYCDGHCSGCNMHMSIEGGDESKSVGIAKLMCDHDPVISLVPENTARMERRADE
ncbi:lysine 2,3-aminomutase [Methanocella sp. CWC-04]|uniref:L-lysine 2,3-aminomutase n=1 Tax=Methanooceanicella nereidis TaxID=2052831 RepID=A0AAP2RG55_9EURY|nr:lysine 2,3-aminomutase [Methanocella sp. CWC-04]MCD1295510.1 lysine 2,3-aminomutase [Methanocella sp. CWC-04]